MKLHSKASIPGIPFRKSATLIIAAPFQRTEATGCDYKICLLKRPGRGTFKNAYVFPGGAHEAVDNTITAKMMQGVKVSHQTTNSLDTMPMRVCAVREAFEEAGAQVLSKPVDADKWRSLVDHDANVFEKLLTEEAVSPAVERLLFWCSFITPDSEAMRMKKGGFETAFYLVVLDEAQKSGLACDGTENVTMAWLSPKEALEAHRVGEISLPPPQWTVLTEMLEHPDLAGLPDHAVSPNRALVRDHVIKPYLLDPQNDPSYEATGIWLAYPGDELHPQYVGAKGAVNRLNIRPKTPYTKKCNVPEGTRLALAAKL